ncbi:MAG: hypothetical protein LUD83_09790 [Clostridiales bacterium]|nr:hypothetical protein [Clostridiales bacterium]
MEYDPGDGRRQNVHTKQWTNTQSTGKITAGKTKYAPSQQRNQVKVQLSPKRYSRLTGILNTEYPGLTPEDGEVIIYDAKYGYKVVADGYGGFNTLYV